MIIEDVSGLPVKTKVTINCDGCGSESQRTVASIKERRKKRGENKDYCGSCAAKQAARKRPQCSAEFWKDPERKQQHSNSIKSSVAYYNGIKNRPSVVGENNPMWGKSFSNESKLSRNHIWKQRTGEKATNWKGGKTSLTFRIKSATQRRYNWFHRVLERDCCTCQQCGATTNLDVHHIRPLNSIIKELIIGLEGLTDSEKFDWLIEQPEIINEDLTNGITLCRKCHKQIHMNWGSHEPTTQE